MEVWPLPGKLTWFHVESRTRPDPHVVKLESFRFNGECECEDFGHHFERLLERGASPSNRLRCDHIVAARNYVLDRECLPGLLAQQNKPKQNESKDDTDRRRGAGAT